MIMKEIFDSQAIYNILVDSIWYNNYFVVAFFLLILVISVCLLSSTIECEWDSFGRWLSLSLIACVGVVGSITQCVAMVASNVTYSNKARMVSAMLDNPAKVKVIDVRFDFSKKQISSIQIEREFSTSDKVFGMDIQNNTKVSVVLTSEMIEKLANAGYKLNQE